jgi:hypothetical protein
MEASQVPTKSRITASSSGGRLCGWQMSSMLVSVLNLSWPSEHVGSRPHRKISKARWRDERAVEGRANLRREGTSLPEVLHDCQDGVYAQRRTSDGPSVKCKRDGGSASLRVECAACDRPRRGGLAVCGGGSGGGENEGDGNGLSMASSISKVCGLAQSPL